MRVIFCAIFVTFIGINGAKAEPSDPIKTMIQTPASAFDVFLFNLREKDKCPDRIFSPAKTASACIGRVEYDFEENLVKFTIFITEEYGRLGNFASSSEEERKKILTATITKLAGSVGITSKYGLIHRVPVRNDWKTGNVDVAKFRTEVASRSVIATQHSIPNEDGETDNIYSVERDHEGKITVRVSKKVPRLIPQ